MEQIKVKPHEIWDYFQQNRSEMANRLHLIAGNWEYGTSIYVTETNGLPEIVVFMDNSVVEEESCATAADCREIAEDLYETYLTVKAVSAALKDNRCSERLMDQDLMIDEREDELDSAFDDLLLIILGDDFYPLHDEIDEIKEDLKDHVCEYLARKFGIDLYRPMYLEDESGMEFFEERPYDCMEFTDPDNPIYK